jgi:hypothetical protein
MYNTPGVKDIISFLQRLSLYCRHFSCALVDGIEMTPFHSPGRGGEGGGGVGGGRWVRHLVFLFINVLTVILEVCGVAKLETCRILVA